MIFIVRANIHTRVILLKDKIGIEITNAFQKILYKSNCKTNKIWIDKGSEFYNISMKSWLENAIEMYSTHNEGKSLDSLEPQKMKFINT